MPSMGCFKVALRLGGAVVAPLMLAVACDRAPSSPPPPAPVADVNAPAPAPAKPTYTLILTWMYGGQPPQTTQTVFHDQAACDQARDAAIAEGRRLALESLGETPTPSDKPPPPAAPRRYIGSALLPPDAGSAGPPPPASAPQSTPPKVAAICAAT
jgi:hypothetical protein